MDVRRLKRPWLLHNADIYIDYSLSEQENRIFYHRLPVLGKKKHAKALKNVLKSQ
jgi:hypothetical protein